MSPSKSRNAQLSRHESPQVIILRNGVAVWNASHWKIKADAVKSAVDQNK